MDQVQALETAILQRAESLAEEYRQRAQRSRDNLLREASDKLRLREDREVLLAKALADRAYRRRVQANELRLQAQLDQVRWSLVQAVIERLQQRLEEFAESEAYLPVLQQFIAQGAADLDQKYLVAELNARDRERLKDGWEDFAATAAPEYRIELSDDPMPGSGGVRLHTSDGRIRFDNSFEGRMKRLERALQQLIVERLFPAGSAEGLNR